MLGAFSAQKPSQPGFPLDQRQAPEILSVQVQQVERKEQAFSPPEQQVIEGLLEERRYFFQSPVVTREGIAFHRVHGRLHCMLASASPEKARASIGESAILPAVASGSERIRVLRQRVRACRLLEALEAVGPSFRVSAPGNSRRNNES